MIFPDISSTSSPIRNEALIGGTELTVKLESAFLCGLRCSQVQVRARFFEVYNESMKKRLFDRLLYAMCTQNWEHCGGFFWIKHCLEVHATGRHSCPGGEDFDFDLEGGGGSEF